MSINEDIEQLGRHWFGARPAAVGLPARCRLGSAALARLGIPRQMQMDIRVRDAGRRRGTSVKRVTAAQQRRG
jgi:hypothetical protein